MAIRAAVVSAVMIMIAVLGLAGGAHLSMKPSEFWRMVRGKK